jgi:hypothetical protein
MFTGELKASVPLRTHGVDLLLWRELVVALNGNDCPDISERRIADFLPNH